jgi:hypothetical protein
MSTPLSLIRFPRLWAAAAMAHLTPPWKSSSRSPCSIPWDSCGHPLLSGQIELELPSRGSIRCSRPPVMRLRSFTDTATPRDSLLPFANLSWSSDRSLVRYCRTETQTQAPTRCGSRKSWAWCWIMYNNLMQMWVEITQCSILENNVPLKYVRVTCFFMLNEQSIKRAHMCPGSEQLFRNNELLFIL